MKKRLTCLLLCLVMMFSVVLASCSQQTSDEDTKDKITDDASQNAITLTMWLVSEEKVSEEIANDVEEEINKVTKTKFKTQLEITFLTKDEYYQAVTSNIAAYEAAKEAAKLEKPEEPEESETESGETGTGDGTTAAEEETYIDEDGLVLVKYPEAKKFQVDIIYVGDLVDADGNVTLTGEAFYNELLEKNWLAALDGELENSSKKIKEYVAPTLLSAVQKDGSTYAIPNNNVIGEYKYMLLNKTLMDRYSMNGYFARGEIENFYNDYIYEYLNLITLCEDNSKVLPIDASFDDCLKMLAYYWNINPDDYSVNSGEFSIFGTLYEDLSTLSRGETSLEVESLFANPDFVKAYLKLNKYRLDTKLNYFRTEENKDVAYEASAIKFVNGDLTILTEVNGVSYYYDENGTAYYVVPVEYPKATTEDIYSNMIAVCSHTVNVSRSMEIVTYMNTNAELRNLIQYGVEGEHYTRQENGKIIRLSDQKGNQYLMDIYATGNAFLAYPEPEMNANIWESGKVQNRSSLVDPLLGFELGAFADTTKEEPTVSLDIVKGYNLNHKSGYTKEVLSENADLKAWLDKCDEKGSGIYAFRSTDIVDKKYLYGTFYIYNSTGSGVFSIQEEYLYQTVKDEYDVETEVVSGVRLTPVYSEMTNEGYTLTVVTVICPKDYQYEMKKCLVGETEKDMVLQDVAGLVNFDFYNTQNYNIVAYEDLTIPYIRYNKLIYSLVEAAYGEASSLTGNYVASYIDTTSSDENDYYTYLVYRERMAYVTVLNLVPAYKDGNLVMNFNFLGAEVDSNKVAVDQGQRSYVLSYYRVAVPKGTLCSYNVSLNGGVDGIYDETGRLISGAVQYTKYFDADPKFEMRGQLNTELVKFAAQLNSEILALLDSCTKYEDFEKMVNGLSVLLRSSQTPNKNAVNEASNSLNALNKYMGDRTKLGSDFTTLFDNIRHLTNWETMDIVKNLEEPETWKNGDTYVYYLSPFGVYYLWMQTYGYLPAE